jgi:hypothetical protein
MHEQLHDEKCVFFASCNVGHRSFLVLHYSLERNQK